MADVVLKDCECSSKTTAMLVKNATASDTYFFASSRMEVTNKLRDKAATEAWDKVRPAPSACTPPCKPYVLYANIDISYAIDEWDRWWSGFVPWAAHYAISVTATVTCDVISGCDCK